MIYATHTLKAFLNAVVVRYVENVLSNLIEITKRLIFAPSGLRTDFLFFMRLFCPKNTPRGVFYRVFDR